MALVNVDINGAYERRVVRFGSAARLGMEDVAADVLPARERPYTAQENRLARVYKMS
jgi:hypothetical protein